MVHKNDFKVFKSLIKDILMYIFCFIPNKINPIYNVSSMILNISILNFIFVILKIIKTFFYYWPDYRSTISIIL